jgi:hypothetical protein
MDWISLGPNEVCTGSGYQTYRHWGREMLVGLTQDVLIILKVVIPAAGSRESSLVSIHDVRWSVYQEIT